MGTRLGMQGNKVALFTTEYAYKVDRKGRVSVPADYRQALASQSFQGIVIFPADGLQALDGYGHDRVEQLAEALDNPELYGEDELALAELLFAEAHRLPFDADGRVLLPEACLKHAALTEQVTFAGHGKYFRLWNPAAYESYKAAQRAKMAATGKSLRLKPIPKTGGAA